jgi:hypothetical protein
MTLPASRVDNSLLAHNDAKQYDLIELPRAGRRDSAHFAATLLGSSAGFT